MKKFRKVATVFLFIFPAVIGFVGYMISNYNVPDSLYYAVRMYLFDADTTNNNIFIELARWSAPIFTVSGLAIILKKAVSKMIDFFSSFTSDAIALYGDNELKEIVRKNIKHAINVDDNKIMDVESHIIMFSTDEKSLEFYTANKDKLCGEVLMKIDKNDSYSIALDNVRFFNPCEIIARKFWQENDLSGVIEKPKMKIAIVGSDVLSRKILTYGLLNNIYSTSQEIEYNIWSDDDFFEKAHSDFETMNLDTVVYCDNKSKDRLQRIASADRIIITEAIDNELLSELSKMSKGEIYCFDPLGTFVDIFESGDIHSFGRYSEVLTAENIRTRDLYEFAKRLNFEYAQKYAQEGENPTLEGSWAELDAFTKGSNVASTDYHKIMLIVMRKTGKKVADYELAELEHIRWSRYHFINHWKFGETANGKKDSRNKIHPCLKPFDALDDGDKQKDLDGIKTLLSLEGV